MRTRRSSLPAMTWLEDRKLWRKRMTYKGVSINKTGKTKEIVMAKIEAEKKRIDSGIIDDGITFLQYVQRWYPIRVAGLRGKSIDNINHTINKYILPSIGNMLIKDVKPLHIDEILASLSGYSQSINRKVMVELNRIFESAIENNIIVRNPCKGRKARGKRTKEKIPLTAAQQEQLAAAVKDTHAELFVLLCLCAGLRREEALGLLWEDVYLHADAPYIEVKNTTVFDSAGKAMHSPDLKTPSANRRIPLIPLLAEALYKSYCNRRSAFVLPATKSDYAMPLSSFKHMWKIAASAVPFSIEPHLLRHTYISQLCSSGMDIKKIQYLAGHSDPRITMSIYAKVMENQPGELAPAVISAFAWAHAGTPTGTPEAETGAS